MAPPSIATAATTAITAPIKRSLETEFLSQYRVVPVVVIKELSDTIPTLKALCEGGLPIVIGGDFNAVYTESFYNDLLTNCGLTDSDMATDNKITYDSVDHIAVSGVTVTTYIARAVSNSSDHHPIYCDIKIQMPIHLESGEWGRTDNLQDATD